MDKALRTYVKENGLTVTHNTAQGNFKGFHSTVSKGKAHVRISVSAGFSNAEALAVFNEDLYQKSISREYRVLEITFLAQSIDIILSYHGANDVTRIDAFMNYLLPLLRKHNAICTVTKEVATEEVLNSGFDFINTVQSLFNRRNRRCQSN